MAHNLESESAKFKEDYQKNIGAILSMPSGQHPPDMAKVSAWIEAQASERRRQVARALADNIIYITHAELIDTISRLVDKVYGEINIPAENKLILFAGPKTKSNYFISLLFYHFVKEKGFREPDFITTGLDSSYFFIDTKKSTILYVDDMSYSGSQIYKYLSAIYTSELKMKEKHPELSYDIRVCLPFISEEALELLQKVVVSKGFLVKQKYDNPYPIYSIRIIPSLKKILGEKLFTDCLLYFNPYSDSDRICYFDHKIADTLSTFLFVLLFGIVPPAKINWKYIYTQLNRKYMLEKNVKNHGPHTEEIDDDKKENPLQFIPFIKGCEKIDEYLKENLEYFQSLPYDKFMMDLEEYGGQYGDMNVNDDGNILNEQTDPSLQKLLDFMKKRNSVNIRCPRSWYKNMFKGGAKKTKKYKSKRKICKTRRK